MDAIDETAVGVRSGALALVRGPIQFKDITLKELDGIQPNAQASHLPSEPPARSTAVKAFYVGRGSAILKPKGYRNSGFLAMETEDPNGVFDSKPVYFDIHSGNEIHYQVESSAPLTELSYTGVAYFNFWIEIVDAKGAIVIRSGPYNGGNSTKTIRMPLPNLTRFTVALKTNPIDWLLVEDLHFGSARPGVASPANGTPGPTAAAGRFSNGATPAIAVLPTPVASSTPATATTTRAPSTTPLPPPDTTGDNDALKRALLSHSWAWNAMAAGSFPWTEVVFWSDGTMTTSTPANARWTIDGFHSVALQFGAGDRIHLTFYLGLDHFTGCRDDGKVIVSGRDISRTETSSIRPADATPRAATVASAQSELSQTAQENIIRGPERSIFNGRDLTGWSGRSEFWSVQNGAVTGRVTIGNLSGGNTFLVWQGGESSDFELACKYKLTAENPEGLANSGIQFRARFADRELFKLKGYQAEMDPGTNHPGAWPSMPNINGCLTDDEPGTLLAATGQRVIIHPGQATNMLGKFDVMGSLGTSQSSANLFRKNDWNDYRILALGNHIQIFVNGLQTVDAIDEGKRFTAGLIGLQLHGLNKPKTLQFKDISLREVHGSFPMAQANPTTPPSTAKAPTATSGSTKLASKQTFGSYQEEALLGYAWSWDTAENGRHLVIQFLQDGRVSAGWHWHWLPKTSGELVIDCFWRENQHLYLKFNQQFSEFEIYGENGTLMVTGKKLAPVGQDAVISAAQAPGDLARQTSSIPTVKPDANWRVPGLNERSFGHWNPIGEIKIEDHDGIVTLSSRGGRAGIASSLNDFSKYNLHIELAGSPDIEAWVGVRVEVGNGEWTGYTSHISGRDGFVSAGHGGRNFATASKAENPREYEGGLGKVETPAEQLVSHPRIARARSRRTPRPRTGYSKTVRCSGRMGAADA